MIFLKDCFNVVRLTNKKFPFSFALFTKDEKMSFVADSEQDLMRWLNAIETERELQGANINVELKYCMLFSFNNVFVR